MPGAAASRRRSEFSSAGTVMSLTAVHSVPAVERVRFTADQYERMAEAGVLGPQDHVELIEGEIVRMVPMGDPHALCVARFLNRLPKLLPETMHVRVQSPIRLSDATEPEPDVVVVGLGVDACPRHPRPEEILLVVEVSDSSLAYDRDVKLPLYARAGIPEVWIVNLAARRIEIHRRPAEGKYAIVVNVARGESARCESAREIVLAADDLLGRM